MRSSRLVLAGAAVAAAAGLDGSRPALFFAAGPHRWRGASELDVHGSLGSISPRR